MRRGAGRGVPDGAGDDADAVYVPVFPSGLRVDDAQAAWARCSGRCWRRCGRCSCGWWTCCSSTLPWAWGNWASPGPPTPSSRPRGGSCRLAAAPWAVLRLHAEVGASCCLSAVSGHGSGGGCMACKTARQAHGACTEGAVRGASRRLCAAGTCKHTDSALLMLPAFRAYFGTTDPTLNPGC